MKTLSKTKAEKNVVALMSSVFNCININNQVHTRNNTKTIGKVHTKSPIAHCLVIIVIRFILLCFDRAMCWSGQPIRF